LGVVAVFAVICSEKTASELDSAAETLPSEDGDGGETATRSLFSVLNSE
jgi:hypothetical protein